MTRRKGAARPGRGGGDPVPCRASGLWHAPGADRCTCVELGEAERDKAALPCECAGFDPVSGMPLGHPLMPEGGVLLGHLRPEQRNGEIRLEFPPVDPGDAPS